MASEPNREQYSKYDTKGHNAARKKKDGPGEFSVLVQGSLRREADQHHDLKSLPSRKDSRNDPRGSQGV